MAKAKFFKGPNGIINLRSLIGVIKGDGQLYGFDHSGYMRLYLDDDTAEDVIEEAHKLVKKNIGINGVLNTPCGGGLSIDIIDEVYVNPKSGNLIISSIAPDKALLILKADDYSDMDALSDVVQNAVVDLSNDKKVSVDWSAYSA